MEFNAFVTALKSSLVERGIDQNTADRYVTAVSRSFKEDDLKRIATYQKPNDFASLSDSIAVAIKRKLNTGDKPHTSSPQKPRTPARPENGSAEQSGRPQNQPRPAGDATAARRGAPKSFTERVADFFRSFGSGSASGKEQRSRERDDSEILEVGENGKKIYWIAVICLSPLLLFLNLVYLAFFGLLYAAVAAAIVACVILLVGIVAAGSAVALVGLVYGVIRLFTIPAEGLYEIGLAIIIIGLVMLFGILIYNFALRVLPLLFGQIKRLFLFLTEKVNSLLYYLKKECYKL